MSSDKMHSLHVMNPEPAPEVVRPPPAPPPPPPLNPTERRRDTQERRRRLAVAYGAAVTGYPRGSNEHVYALPARFSTATARVDDPVLERTYRAIAVLRTHLATAAAPGADRDSGNAQSPAADISEASDPMAAADAFRALSLLTTRLRPGQRRYLAQQMLGRDVPPTGRACGVCWATLEGQASRLPCGHHFHYSCIQTTLENADTCRCPVCNRDLTLAALLHDAMTHCTGQGDADALWKSLPSDLLANDTVRPLTPPLGGAAPSLAAVKESWRSKVNGAYDAAGVKERAWQLDTDLRRFAYTTPRTLRDRACVVHDIARALDTAGPRERERRATAYLDQHRVRASVKEPLNLNHCCAVCRTPIAASETCSPPCGHVVHTECWPSWFQQTRGTQCPVCQRDIAVFACMATMATPDGAAGLQTAKDLWMTVEEVYF